MPKVYRIELTSEQYKELEVARERHEKAYVRERAAGILKVASGWSLRKTAHLGLLKKHEPETVKEWCTRYLTEGLTGLLVKSGRGRKPAFFPSEPTSSSK